MATAALALAPARPFHQIVDPRALSDAERTGFVDALHACHTRIFSGVDRAGFVACVIDPPAAWTRIFVLRDGGGTPRGYAAFHVYEVTHDGRPITVVRMEAGFETAWRDCAAYRRFALACFARARVQARGPLYFVCCPVHPSSFVVLARHAPTLWTLADASTPPRARRLLSGLARTLGLDPVGEGVFRIGWITRHGPRPARISPEAQTYLRANPGYRMGHGLLTVVPVTWGGVARAGLSLLAGAWRRR